MVSNSCFASISKEYINTTPPWYLFYKNRWFRVFIYCFACATTTLIYFGWDHFVKMLVKNNAYSWLCPNGREAEFQDSEAMCRDQERALASLFMIGNSSEFALGALAGIAFDFIGPLLTAVLGYLFFFVGWIFFMYSSESVQLYIPGMILLGGSTNLIAFPSLVLVDFFPTRQGLVASLVVAAQTIGCMIPPILWAIWSRHPSYSFNDIIRGYLLFLCIPVVILFLLALPVIRPSLAPKEEEEGYIKKEIIESSSLAQSEEKVPKSESLIIKSSDDLKETQDISLWQQLFSVEYCLFTAYYVLQLFQFGYYPAVLSSHVGKKVATFRGHVLPSLAVFGALFGLLVDYSKTLILCFFLIWMVMLKYIFFLFPKQQGLQYAGVALNIVSNSFIYTTKYTYIQEIYPTKYFGVLSGVLGASAGIITLLNLLIERMKVTGATYLNLAFGIFAFVFVYILYIRQKKGINYKSGNLDKNLVTSDQVFENQI